MKAVESDFSVDSSGFTSCRFVKWFDHKWGKERTEHEWIKAHLMIGVQTNIVSAVEMTDGHANDCPQLPGLLATTARQFHVGELSADKAYLSNENLELVERLGGTAFVPFKTNSVAGEAGSVWEKMFLYYQLRREEFLAHYHQRSNAESTFGMLKAKFLDSVRSRSDDAMRNEVLCKFLCHNICVVHLSHLELERLKNEGLTGTTCK